MKKFICTERHYLNIDTKIDNEAFVNIMTFIYNNEEIIKEKFHGIIRRHGIIVSVYFLTKKDARTATDYLNSYLIMEKLNNNKRRSIK